MSNTDTKRRGHSGDEGAGPSALALKIASELNVFGWLDWHPDDAQAEHLSNLAEIIDAEIRPLVEALESIAEGGCETSVRIARQALACVKGGAR